MGDFSYCSHSERLSVLRECRSSKAAALSSCSPQIRVILHLSYAMIYKSHFTTQIFIYDLTFASLDLTFVLLSLHSEVRFMLVHEFEALVQNIQRRQCEEQTIEVKSAARGCPERLYDTFSSFSNQDDGGILVFGLDERQDFRKVGVYDAQDLQKKLMEVGEEMTPVVCPVLSVFDEDGLVFVTAEIPPVDLADRPCFKTARGRLKGSYVRVGDADKPMTEYEVYSFEAYRRKYRDDIRPVEIVGLSDLDQTQLEQYMLRRKQERPNLAALPLEQFYTLAGITRNGQVTLAALLLFCPYPQAYFPQLSIIASRVPSTEMGILDRTGQRFTDSKRIEGTLLEMLDAAMAFVRGNMRTAVRIDPDTGRRTDTPEYPMDAVREAVLNALVHRDYSTYTENMPVQIVMFADRLEIRSPGGLYGRMTLDQLGKAQPDTRNPFLVTMMETLGQTENRYSGIPRIRYAMAEAGLPEPIFEDRRGEFSVCLRNTRAAQSVEEGVAVEQVPISGPKDILAFCVTPRSRKEIADFLGIASTQYAIKRYIEPMVQSGAIRLSVPDHPRSPKQRYTTAVQQQIAARGHTP